MGNLTKNMFLTVSRQCCLTFLHLIITITTAVSFKYGKHFPAGEEAVNYIYSESQGTWKYIDDLNYIWNYYAQFATDLHPFDREALIAAADGNTLFTARDANGYLLCDFNKNLEIDPDERHCGFAFHEHSGKGVNGFSRGNPFSQFWLDDNWLARYMSEAYERPHPLGIVDHPESFMRWKILGADSNNWHPYNSDHFDTLALDGLYFITKNDLSNAVRVWSRSLEKSLAIYNDHLQQYEYPGIHENYHMGLWKIFTEMLAEQKIESELWYSVVQHSVSLRSQILNNQEKDDKGNLLGWISNIGVDSSLINTEGVSVNSLALGANSKFVFEANSLPMMVGNGFFIREYHAVSAVVGLSFPGHISFGPNFPLPSGNYIIQFCLRAPNPIDNIAVVDMFDTTDSKIIRTMVVRAENFPAKPNQWNLIELSVTVSVEMHLYEFRTYWNGKSNLDIAYVRVK